MQCAARGCKRRAKHDEVNTGLCMKHGWWYAATHQGQYAHMCEAVFPLWSAADIVIWLTWIGV